MKTFFLYKTTNLITGKYYIGVHGTKNLKNDKYLGSGTALRAAIRKYGRQSFSREILEFFNTADEAYAREVEVVSENLLRDPNCYNLVKGGKGGVLGLDKPEDFREKIRRARLGVPRPELQGVPKSEKHKQKISEALTGRHLSEEHKEHLRHPKYNNTYVKTEEHLRKISESLKGHGVTEKQREAISKARKGKIWVIKDGRKKLISKEDSEKFLRLGYEKFRKEWKEKEISCS